MSVQHQSDLRSHQNIILDISKNCAILQYFAQLRRCEYINCRSWFFHNCAVVWTDSIYTILQTTPEGRLLARVDLRPQESKIWFYQSLAREDTNHTLSKKAKNESHRDGFLKSRRLGTAFPSRLDWFGSPAA